MNKSQIKARIDTMNALFVLKLKLLQPETIQSFLKKKESRHG